MAASLQHQQNDPCEEEDGTRMEAGYECKFEKMLIGV